MRYADVDLLVRRVQDALRTCLRAVLDADPSAARRVLESTPERDALREAAQEVLRARAWVPAPQLGEELRFVAEIWHVSELVDDLARRLIRVDGRETLPPSDALEVAALLDAGSRHLERLLGPHVAPGRGERSCTSTLFELVDHGSTYSSPTVRCCGDVATGLLRASRLASAVS